VSLVLISLTTAWTWQTVSKQLSLFDNDVTTAYESHRTLLAELFSNSFGELSQFSQLIVSNIFTDVNSQGVINSDTINQSLTKDWLMLNVNIGLDYIAIYDADKSLLTELSEQSLAEDIDFRETVIVNISSEATSVGPANYIYCKQVCYIINVEPFVDEAGATKFIAVAQNMIQLVQVFSVLSGSELAILVERGQAISGRTIEPWGLDAYAISNFELTYPTLKAFAAKHDSPENPDSNLYFVDNTPYIVKRITLNEISSQGGSSVFVAITDHSDNRQAMIENIQRGVLFGLLGLIITEAILLLSISGAIRKLANISSALYLLPQQKFLEAQKLVDHIPSALSDELSLLQESTFNVTQDLQQLHLELQEKNKFLTEQVSALSRSRAFLTRLFDNSHIFVVTQKKDGAIVSSNRKFFELHENQPDNFTEIIYSNAVLHDHQDQLQNLINKKIDVFQQQMSLVDKNRKNFIITWTHSLVEDEKGNEIVLSTGMDQTKEKTAENNLRWMANHDSLTGIGNRRSFNSFLETLLKNNAKGALVFIDVNRFKQINDIYGHGAGDLVLMSIAKKLQAGIRASDKISRFAGDEFTAILPDISSNDLTQYLARLTSELSSTVELENGAILSYTVSIGAALFPQHGSDLESLVVNADMAMYHAKEKGLGYWHIFDHTDDRVIQIKHDNSLLVQLKKGIECKRFNVVYQPIMDIQSGKVSHYEALLRMNDEAGKPISPSIFIPLAEKSGEIRAIDSWVIDRTVADLKVLLSSGLKAGFAINVSAPTLQSGDFVDLVINSIEHYDVPPNLIIIELTETSYIENFQQVLQNLKKVTNIGVRVALDDFGVGFSSFTYLKKLPLTFVKLDGSYIKNIVRNTDDQVFVKSLSAMINAFGMYTVAEFVEDAETLELLASLGVSHAQGYHLGRPEALHTYFNVAKTFVE
jgi:diguanylate cyclase (GGDEF)-like protein